MVALMALNALAIDIMLPALDAIARDFRVADPNDQQLVIFAYILGRRSPATTAVRRPTPTGFRGRVADAAVVFSPGLWR